MQKTETFYKISWTNSEGEKNDVETYNLLETLQEIEKQCIQEICVEQIKSKN